MKIVSIEEHDDSREVGLDIIQGSYKKDEYFKGGLMMLKTLQLVGKIKLSDELDEYLNQRVKVS